MPMSWLNQATPSLTGIRFTVPRDTQSPRTPLSGMAAMVPQDATRISSIFTFSTSPGMAPST